MFSSVAMPKVLVIVSSTWKMPKVYKVNAVDRLLAPLPCECQTRSVTLGKGLGETLLQRCSLSQSQRGATKVAASSDAGLALRLSGRRPWFGLLLKEIVERLRLPRAGSRALEPQTNTAFGAIALRMVPVPSGRLNAPTAFRSTEPPTKLMGRVVVATTSQQQ